MRLMAQRQLTPTDLNLFWERLKMFNITSRYFNGSSIQNTSPYYSVLGCYPSMASNIYNADILVDSTHEVDGLYRDSCWNLF